MFLLPFLGISDALAAPQHATVQSSFLSSLPMLLVFMAAFYFLLIRPQSKQAKAHKNLLACLAVGDEVLTSGGIIGIVKQLDKDYLIIAIDHNHQTCLTLQRRSVTKVLPKGSLQSIQASPDKTTPSTQNPDASNT